MHQDQGRLLRRTSELALGFLDRSADGRVRDLGPRYRATLPVVPPT
ncbi:MAG: hypothetical protein IH996_05095 [Proteobacteria bacterium]|nr:hypothetical protein [Pseudomonadota bacterium]